MIMATLEKHPADHFHVPQVVGHIQRRHASRHCRKTNAVRQGKRARKRKTSAPRNTHCGKYVDVQRIHQFRAVGGCRSHQGKFMRRGVADARSVGCYDPKPVAPRAVIYQCALMMRTEKTVAIEHRLAARVAVHGVLEEATVGKPKKARVCCAHMLRKPVLMTRD